MTVKELKDILEKYPNDSPVFFEVTENEDGTGDIYWFDGKENQYKKKNKSVVSLCTESCHIKLTTKVMG